MVHRLFTLFRRILRARKFGVSFMGTTHFRLPEKFKIGDRYFPYQTPGEEGNAHDFINLALDDEYGIESLSETPQTVLDIGANCGLFSLLMTQRFPDAVVHAYEPNPRVYSCALQNVRGTVVRLFPEGIGSVGGFATLSDIGDSTLARTTQGESGSIPIVSLHEAIQRFPAEKIDLLKLDCEGAEWAIFKDLQPFKKVKRIRMEYHLVDGKKWEDLAGVMEKLEFKIEKAVKNNGFGIVWLVGRQS
jgi:FkbM family methyltransferase